MLCLDGQAHTHEGRRGRG